MVFGLEHERPVRAHSPEVSTSSAHLVRAASFVIGAAMAALLAVGLGIIEPRRPIRVVSVNPPASGEPAPVIVPLDQAASGRQRPSTPRDEPPPMPVTAPPSPTKPITPPPAKPFTTPPPRTAPKRSRRESTRPRRTPPDAPVVLDELTDRPAPDGPATPPERAQKAPREALPDSYFDAERAMQRLMRQRKPSQEDVNKAASVVVTAAEALDNNNVTNCLDNFFIGAESSARLAYCWRKLEASVQ